MLMEWRYLGVLLVGLCCTLPVVWGQGYVNIVPGKIYNQSSTRTSGSRYFSSYAADGITDDDKFFESNTDFNPFWEVDLGRKYPVHNITLWSYSSEPSGRYLHPSSITVDGQHCVNVSSNPTGFRNHSVTCSSLLYGQRVRITKTTTSTFLVLREFEIFVPRGNSRCDEGRWGPQCQYYCDNNCGGRAGTNFCNQSTLNCYDECVAGRWGERCQKRCGQNCVTGNCDLETGNCSACIAGWYGEQCNKTCPSHSCLLNTCHQTTGRCLACHTGYDGDNCTECGQGFSKNHTASCSPCSAFCNKGGCDAITGNCTNACTPGWYGDQCTTRCPSHSCLLNTCHQKTGRCLACHTGYDGENCTGMKDESSQQSSVPVVGAILGAGLMLTIAVISVLVFLCWKHRSQKTVQDAETVAASSSDPVTAPNNVYSAPPTASPSISPSASAPAGDVTPHVIRDPGNTYEQLRIYSNMVFDREAHSEPEPRGNDATTALSTSEHVQVSVEHIYANTSSATEERKPRKKKAN